MARELHGEQAGQRWRELRPGFYTAMVVCLAYVGAAWLWWDATEDELAAAGMGLTLISWAAFLWRYRILAFWYSSETVDGKTSETLKEVSSPVSPRVAIPVLLFGGAVLLAPSVPIPGADWIRPATSAVLTARDAAVNATAVPGIILGSVLVPLVLTIFVLFGIGLVFAPFVNLFVSMTGRGDPGDADWALLPFGLLVLGFVALAVYAAVTQWDQTWGDYLRPFKDVAGWFS